MSNLKTKFSNFIKAKWIIQHLFKSLFVLIFISILISIWLITCESGLKAIVYTVQPFVPGTLNIEKISGSLFRTITFENIHYQTHQMKIKADKFRFKGEWLSLLQKNYQFDDILLENAEIIFIDSAEPQNKILKINKAEGQFKFFERGNLYSVQLNKLQGEYLNQVLQLNGGISFKNGLLTFQNVDFSLGKHKLTIQPKESEPQLAVFRYQSSYTNPQGFVEVIHSQGDLRTNPGFLSIDSILNIGRKKIASIKGHLALQDPSKNETLEKTMKGNIEAELLDLNPIYHLVPVISRLKAKPLLKAEISGTLLKPIVALNFDIGNAIFSIQKQRLTIKYFQLRVSGILNQDLAVESSGIIANNPFYIKGIWNPIKEGMPSELHLTGKALRIFNTENIRIVVSPDLTLKYFSKTLSIKGNVDIIEGNIIQKKESNSVIVSNDVVFLGQHGLNIHPGSIQLLPEIQLKLPHDNFHFKGYGLDADVGGSIYIEQRKDKLYTGHGRIILREGKYRLPNGTGNIHRGYLYYPRGTLLSDPVLDIRVLQHARDKLNVNGDVGVYVQGSLQKPVYHLYSSEPLKQNEILSKLGFGGTQFQGEDNQRKILSQTAVLLGSGANPLLENIQTKLGLEEFGIQSGNATKYIATQEGNDATLVVGKSLSERFYLQFMQGMLVPSSTLKLQYFLSPYVAISGETSTTGLGGDISFSVEKD